MVLYAVEDAFGTRMDACGGVVIDAVDDMFGARLYACGGVVLDAVEHTFGVRLVECGGMVSSYHINFISIRTIHQKSEQQKSYGGVGWKAT